MTLPFPADIATPIILIALVLAAVLLMLQLAVGPFGHVRFIHLHQSYRKYPAILRKALSSAAITIIIIAFAHLLGLIAFIPTK